MDGRAARTRRMAGVPELANRGRERYPDESGQTGSRRNGGRAEQYRNGRAVHRCYKYDACAAARHTYLASRLTVINEAVPPGRDLPIAHRAG